MVNQNSGTVLTAFMLCDLNCCSMVLVPEAAYRKIVNDKGEPHRPKGNPCYSQGLFWLLLTSASGKHWAPPVRWEPSCLSDGHIALTRLQVFAGREKNPALKLHF